MDRLAMEWGYKACERGLNIQAAFIEFDKLNSPQLGTEENLAPWQREPFTDEDRKSLWTNIREEIRDDLDGYTERTLDEMTPINVIGYLVNVELLLPYHKLQNPPDGMTTEELLTEIAEEPEGDHADLLRFKLLEEDESLIGGYRITDLGIDVLQEFY